MANKIFLTLFFVSCTLLFGQTGSISSITPNSAKGTQTLTLSLSGTGTNFNSVTQIMLYQGTYLVPSNSYNVVNDTVVTGLFNIPPSAPPGFYDVYAGSAAPLLGGFEIQPGPGTNWGFVSGHIYNDDNTNCVFDGMDSPFINRTVIFNPGPFYANTDTAGYYGTWLPLGNYTISLVNHPMETAICPPNTLSLNVNSAGATYPNNDFFRNEVQYFDLETNFHFLPLRPGFNRNIRVSLRNRGNIASPAGSLATYLDTTLTYISSTPTPTISNDTLYWALPSVPPNQIIYFNNDLLVPVATPLGTSIYLWTHAFPDSGDVNPYNNNSVRFTPTVGAYDPNDKQVWNERGMVADGFIDPTDTLLEYLIRFQNTGTADAINIFVRDTLDPNVDVSTFKTLDASHPYSLSLSGSGNIEWYFANIHLPDSNANEPGSHGYISYSVVRDPTLPIGGKVENTAHIYFDFNPAVVTNTVSSMLCPSDPVGIDAQPSGLTVSFSDTNAANHTSWFWDFGDGNTDSTANPNHSFSSGGVHNVCLTTINQCGRSDSSCIEILLVGMGDPSWSKGLIIFPNPGEGSFEVIAEFPTVAKPIIRLKNPLGATLFQSMGTEVSGTFRKNLDLKKMPAGIYFLEISWRGETVVRKIVKM